MSSLSPKGDAKRCTANCAPPWARCSGSWPARRRAGKLTRLRPPHKDECCVTAQGWRGREETRPPRHADSFAPAYRPERPLRLRAGGLQRLATARRAAADRHAARCASRGLCSGVRPSTLYALGSNWLKCCSKEAICTCYPWLLSRGAQSLASNRGIVHDRKTSRQTSKRFPISLVSR